MLSTKQGPLVSFGQLAMAFTLALFTACGAGGSASSILAASSPPTGSASVTQSYGLNQPSPVNRLGAKPGDTQAFLKWSHVREAGLIGFRVYRSSLAGGPFAPITPVLVPSLEFTDTGLVNGVTQYYYATAIDNLGKESTQGKIASVTPQVAPANPTGLVASGGDFRVDLDWADNAEPNLNGYRVYRSFASGGPYKLLTPSLIATSDYMDSGLLGGIPAHYVVTAENLPGVESGFSQEAFGVPTDSIAPSAPTGLTGMPGDSLVDLDWSDNPEPDLIGYLVYRSTFPGGPYVLATPQPLATSDFHNPGLPNGLTLFYVVTAKDLFGNESAQSLEVVVTPTPAPAQPSGLIATAGDTVVNLDWNDNTEADLAGYRILASAQAGGPYELLHVGLWSFSHYSHTDLPNGLALFYVVQAENSTGLISIESQEVSGTPTAPIAAPAAPTGLAAQVGEDSVALDWNDNSEPALNGYLVYRSDHAGGLYTQLAPGLIPSSQFLDTGLNLGQTYHYVVAAVDLFMVTSTGSAEVSAVPTDTTAPAAPTGLFGLPGTTSITLDWNDNTEPDLSGYSVYRGTNPGGPYTQIASDLQGRSRYKDKGVSPGRTYYHVVTGSDLAGNESTFSNEAATTVGSTQQNPDGTTWFAEANAGGLAPEVFIQDVYWGRLVDVFDAAGTLRHRDFLIGEDIQTDGIDYQLDINAVTEQASVRILHAFGSAAYNVARNRLDLNLGQIAPKSDVGDLPPFSMLPRNAAMAIRFSDLIDPATLGMDTVRMLVGTPPTAPYEARLLMDPNHGGTFGGQFHSTRVLVDLTVSEVEAAGGLLSVNSIGLPASSTNAFANAALRIPSQLDFGSGQFQLLQNPSGKGLATAGNGPVDFGSSTVDVVRAMRSGGPTAVTGDPSNGFLMDTTAPRIVGVQPVTLSSIAPDGSGGPSDFTLSIQFTSIACAQAIRVGDVLQLPGVFAEATALSGPPTAGFISTVKIRAISGDTASLVAGPAQHHTVFDKAMGDNSDCFVSFSPLAGILPNNAVEPDSQVLLRFSEPIEPASVQAMETFAVAKAAVTSSPMDLVIGGVTSPGSSKEFLFTPTFPLPHAQGMTELYFVSLQGGVDGPTDLAGNPLAETLDQTQFNLNATAPSTAINDGIVLLFGAANEDGDLAGSTPLTEYAGQFLLDPVAGTIQSRPVQRFSASADQSQAVPSLMISLPAGVQTPFSPLGSRMMDVYRHFDVGFALEDSATHNIDIEGINWAPLAGQVQADFFEGFEINLHHSVQLPDERKGISLLPMKPASGLFSNSFAANILLDPNSSGLPVHPKALGYFINPSDAFLSGTGATLIPYPLNTSGPVDDFSYFTWRDTGVQALGAANGFGVPTSIEAGAGLTSPFDTGTTAAAGNVPTIGLPLLMEFKCYPTATGIGLNSLASAIAINSSPKPTFRIFSTGGYSTGGLAVYKNPDTQFTPSGGFNADPSSGLAIGATTSPADNVFYYGQLDLVVRVSRTVTRWFDTGSSSPDYMSPLLAYGGGALPAGTEVVVQYRGASSIASVVDPIKDPLLNADFLDAYGDELQQLFTLPTYGSAAAKNPSITFADYDMSGSPDSEWRNQIDDIDSSRFIQVRFTMISNTATGEVPSISAFGLPYVL